MSKRDYRLLLEDILEAVHKIKTYTNGLSYEQFVEDVKTSDAVIRNFEIIGEAANNIPEVVKEKHQEIEWHKIVGIKNRIIHEYFGVDYKILWRIISNNLDELKEKIENILK
jgi:uncharacterized protein with HEPN domain